MYIGIETTAKDIADQFAHPLSSTTKANLAKAIDDFTEIRIQQNTLNTFKERLQSQSKDKSKAWNIAGHNMDLFNDVADRLPAEAKAGLMRLSYEDLAKLKRQREKAIFKELIDFLSFPIVDRYDSYPIDFPEFISQIDKKPYTQEHYLKLLKTDKIMVPRVIKVLEALQAEYKVQEDENHGE